MAKDEKTCFIIMPITTPPAFREQYRDGPGHFTHVLECLFVPSVEKAGYKAIRPKAQGADLIQASIIENLEQSDLLLCDMSCLNPNVFFEFGIRVALNKPVCVVKDKLAGSVPFDTAILNYREYDASLDAWELEEEVEKLTQHIHTSQKRSKGSNALWRYFGLKTEARPFEGARDRDNILDYIRIQIESLSQHVLRLEAGKSAQQEPHQIGFEILAFADRLLPKSASAVEFEFVNDGDIKIYYTGQASHDDLTYAGLAVARRYERRCALLGLEDQTSKPSGNEVVTFGSAEPTGSQTSGKLQRDAGPGGSGR